jgi:multiple sugar transport system permease protein
MREPGLAGKAARLGLAALALLWSVFPIALVVLASLKPSREIFSVPPSFVFTPVLDHYARLWQAHPQFFRDLGNSAIITIGATLLTMIATAMAGYVYSRMRSRLRTASAFFMVLVRMLPPIVVTLPLFPAVNAFGLNDTHILLIGLYAAFFVSLGTWIMKAFIDQIPKEIDEAAVIDGATPMQILLRLIMPLAAQGTIAASIFVFIYAWNEFLFALIFTTRNARTAPLVLSEILGTVEGVEWGVLFAAATIQLVPILLVVLLMQRWVVAGLTAGAVKS